MYTLLDYSGAGGPIPHQTEVTICPVKFSPITLKIEITSPDDGRYGVTLPLELLDNIDRFGSLIHLRGVYSGSSVIQNDVDHPDDYDDVTLMREWVAGVWFISVYMCRVRIFRFPLENLKMLGAVFREQVRLDCSINRD